MKNNISSTDWLIKGISNEQLQIEKALAVISAKIYIKRTEMGLDQKAFAKYMGVTQGLVSRWESGSYNFSISTLINICEKLGLIFEPKIIEEELSSKNVSYVSPKANIIDKSVWETWRPENKTITGEGVA